MQARAGDSWNAVSGTRSDDRRRFGVHWALGERIQDAETLRRRSVRNRTTNKKNGDKRIPQWLETCHGWLHADASDAGNEHVCGTYDSSGNDAYTIGGGDGEPRYVEKGLVIGKWRDESFQQAAEQVPHGSTTER